ncbi:MAG: response regulator [Telmatospirillum sp.]|nr:response regulator [Telmatospirillum sp.]
MNNERYANLVAMVIDDQAVVRAMMGRMLTQLGFGVVVEARDGAQAMADIEAAERLPSVILCDIGMKPMDGMSFLAALRERPEIHISRIPVILLTATASSELADRARTLRANGYIVKPVTPDVLALRVERAMAR